MYCEHWKNFGKDCQQFSGNYAFPQLYEVVVMMRKNPEILTDLVIHGDELVDRLEVKLSVRFRDCFLIFCRAFSTIFNLNSF